MAASVAVQITYPKSDFTAGGGNLNIQVLRAELDAVLSVPLIDSFEKASNVTLVLGDAPANLSTELAAIDAVVAAHTNPVFGATAGKVNSLGQSTSSNNGVWVQKVAVDSGPLPEGTYRISGVAEYDISGGGEVDVRFLINGTPFLSDSNASTKPNTFSPSGQLSIQAGSSIVLAIEFRLDGVVGTARCRVASVAYERV